ARCRRSSGATGVAGQHIPRPAGARPGAGPPWPVLAPARADRGVVRIADVRRAVLGRRPEAPDVLDGRGQSEVPPAGAHRPSSAVLVAVWEEDREARLLLTRRGTWMRSHSGQVAFPGGRVEPGEDLVDAALREAAEEVALDPASVEVVGRLRGLHTVSSGADIHPFVGLLPGRPLTVANPAEVDRVFDVAIAELMTEGVFHEEIWDLGGTERPVYFFDVAGETVWGATAFMLHDLLALVALVARGRPGPA
ncbi:MAG TPA: CoA pyrophosphatase, partial [Acidimicrobiales bacterium]|nr:CoA pyrophosphatase [Acidimicrobiales bacterium]